MEQRVRLTLEQLKRCKCVRYHESLPDHLIERIRSFKDTFTEFYPATFEEWVDGFCEDMDPEREIAIWEEMAQSYTKLLKIRHSMTREERGKIYKEVLLEAGRKNPIVIGDGCPPMA